MKNPQRTVARVWLGVTVVAAFLTALPFLIGIDGMSGGFALALVSFFVAISGVIVALVFGSRARALDGIVSGRDLLARWSVDPQTRKGAIELEFSEEKKAKAGLFLVVLVITVVIGLVFVLVDREAGPIVFLVLLGVLVLVGLVAWSTPRLRRRRSLRAAGEILIAKDGAYVNGMFHTWRLLGARLEQVEYKDGTPPVLAISYSAPVRYGRQSYTFYVPVPAGEEEAGRRVADQLNETTR